MHSTTPKPKPAPTLYRYASVLLACAGLAAFSACSEGDSSTAEPVATTASASAESEPATIAPMAWQGSQTITIDGDVSEWPEDVAAVADAHWLYLRFKLDGPTRTLQGMDTPVAIWLDADGNPATGRTIEEPAVRGGLGADIEVIFSPREVDAPRVGQGVMFRVHQPDGTARVVTHDPLGFHFAPTFASEWYEARISRSAAEALGLNTQGLGSTGRIAGVVAMMNGQNELRAWADPFELTPPPAAPWQPQDARVPAKPQGAARVIAYNVEHSSPMKNPEPFARVIGALQPDVMLFQEWVEGDASAIKAWLTAHIDDSVDWHVLKGRAWGVAVASRYPLTELTPMDAPNPVNAEQALRFIGALAQTPQGPLAVGSTHLKCCGTKDSREDRQRAAEATAIADMLAKALAQTPGSAAWGVVVGGDLNLVGSRPPLEAIARAIDLDGSDLAVAAPMVLGDQAMYTWADAGNAFTPGRLDYLLYSDGVAEAVNTFVLDTSRLSEAALARLGLDATDTSASDHLPVVIDLRPSR